jgi:hypothetical protein
MKKETVMRRSVSFCWLVLTLAGCIFCSERNLFFEESLVDIFPSTCVVAFKGSSPVPEGTTALGSIGELSWYAIKRSEIDSLLTIDSPSMFLLYSSEREYRAGTGYLTDSEVKESVAHRLQSMEFICYRAIDRIGLECGLAAHFLGSKAAAIPARMQAENLRLAVKELDAIHCSAYELNGPVAYNVETIGALLRLHVFIDNCEQTAFEKFGKDPRAAIIREYRTGDTLTYALLASLAEALGEPAYVKAPLPDSYRRMCLVSADNPIIAAWKHDRQLSVIPFGDKVFVPLRPIDINKLSKTDTPEIIFLTGDDYERKKTEFSAVQFEKYVKARAATGGPPVEYILKVMLEERLNLLACLKLLCSQKNVADKKEVIDKLKVIIQENGYKVLKDAECLFGTELYEKFVAKTSYRDMISLLALLAHTAEPIAEPEVRTWSENATIHSQEVLTHIN